MQERPTNLNIGRAKANCACRGGRLVRWYCVNFQCRGVLLTWIIVGQGPNDLAVGASGGCLDIFSNVYHFPLSGRRSGID